MLKPISMCRGNLTSLYPDADISFLYLFHQGADLPRVQDGDVLKREGAREIFYMMNSTIHMVPNMEVFVKLGKDLDQVVNLCPDDMAFMQIGDPLPEK